MLEKKPEYRLGTKDGFKEVYNHPWISKHYDMEKLLAKGYQASFKPKASKNPLDVGNFDSEFTDEKVELTMIGN